MNNDNGSDGLRGARGGQVKHDARRKHEEHGGHQGKQRRMIKREWRVTHLNKDERGNIDGMRRKKNEPHHMFFM